jgi:transcription elongation factor GreA
MQDLARKISAARAEGDLSENAEYHALKDEQGHVHSKILRLQERLRNAVVVEAPAATDEVAFGGSVEVTDESTGKRVRWTLVGATEADVKTGKLSAESPVARALLGRKPGEAVQVQTPGGARTYRIEAVG